MPSRARQLIDCADQASRRCQPTKTPVGRAAGQPDWPLRCRAESTCSTRPLASTLGASPGPSSSRWPRNLERESETDDDYYLTAETVDLLSDRGVDASAIAVLRHALGGRPGMDLRWVQGGRLGSDPAAS